MPNQSLYIGLMSGTSADGVDAALVDLSGQEPKLLATQSLKFEAKLQDQIHQLCHPGDNEMHRMGVLDAELGGLFADVVNNLLKAEKVKAKDIVAIGSHGQTVRHNPPNDDSLAYTVQIANPSIIAQQTGITTVADFRRRDMAVGGQGAPLVPAFHKAAFASPKSNRAIINIGGIANLTLLPVDGETSGYDIGPGNTLMDQWVQHHQGKTYDEDGSWAADGEVDEALMDVLLAHAFFKQEPPKSTGRELFNIEWLNNQIRLLDQAPKPINVQATLLEVTARTISDAVRKSAYPSFEIYLCGGGALNPVLTDRLQSLLHPAMVCTTDHVGIAPQWVEASAFAWLAKQTLEHLPGNLSAVTGAKQEVILGGVYFANP